LKPITKEDCTQMLCWDFNEDNAKIHYVFAYIPSAAHPYKVLLEDGGTSAFENAKPLPETRLLTNLEAMWWAGVRKVVRSNYSGIMHCIRTYHTEDNVSKWRWNELELVEGNVSLKYAEWKKFNTANCKLDEE
jgi:hypothetical protein